MKTLLVLFLACLWITVAFADNFDVPEEVIKVNKSQIDTISIMPSQSFAVIQIFKGYEVEVEIEGETVKRFIPTKTIRLEFRDQDYTDLMATITIDKGALVQIIKSKL